MHVIGVWCVFLQSELQETKEDLLHCKQQEQHLEKEKYEAKQKCMQQAEELQSEKVTLFSLLLMCII